MRLEGSRIGVLDINHGGLAIAEKLAALGFDAFAVDVYGTKKKVTSKVPVLKPDEVTSYDALVAPVHMPTISLLREAYASGKAVYTHHQAVGHILERTGALHGICSIEMTGTYGKTTACTLLARMLPDVLLHTSRGLFFNHRLIRKKLSITPANILVALDLAKERGFTPLYCIFEVSLGGTGMADIGVITTMDRDYTIAEGARMASEAKIHMVTDAKEGSTLVHFTGVDFHFMNEVTFGEGGDVQYTADGNIKFHVSVCGRLAVGKLTPAFSGGFDPDAYMSPALCAVAVALAAGAKPGAIEAAFENFTGVEGRMRLTTLEERDLLDNSNSGLSFEGIESALAIAGEHDGKKVLVIGEEAYNVCDGLDPRRAFMIIENTHMDDVVLVGERLRTKGYSHSDSLKEGLALALERTAPGDLIISCVKTWR
jgi:coenzyme F430 synthetase